MSMNSLEPGLRERIENTIRCLTIDAVEQAGCGHPGAPMGLARPAFTLWDSYLNFDPEDPCWPLRDRFVLSAGHASMLLYSLLHLFGFELTREDLGNFRQLGSVTPGHPEYGETPGVEMTTGPLGQGFAHGVGMALAGMLARRHFGRNGQGPGYHRVFGIVSDGDLMEGVSYEAASLAGHLGLGNLIYLYDDNLVTIDGGTNLSFSENVRGRFESQGWHVAAADGGDALGLQNALDQAIGETGRPSLIIVRTTIGYGSPNLAGSSKVHGSKLGAAEAALTKSALNWPSEPLFFVPEEVGAYLKTAQQRKRARKAELEAGLARWREEYPDLARAWDDARARRVPADLAETLVAAVGESAKATRIHSGAVLEQLTQCLPYMVGGSADLAGSAAPPLIKGSGPVGPVVKADPFAGRNLYFGVREHAMAAVTNGIHLDGTFFGYCGTFLIFSDYLRPSMRLAALMRQPATYVLTHDSVFLGEDGPTHQPIEHLDSLRAMPNLTLFRPADGVETAMAWTWAVTRARGPVVLALTRQTVPLFDRTPDFKPSDVWRGGYAVSRPTGDPDVIFVATGSEVPVASAAAQILTASGIHTRVVSMPCLELFLEQSAGYREDLIPRDGTPVVIIEAGIGESLRRVAGGPVLMIGMTRFGASAPQEDLAKLFGFSAESIADRTRRHIRR